MTVLHYIHHAAFSLNDGKTTLLFDPYLENNPEGLSSGDLKADYIFISHFHGDHVGEAYAIAKRTEALIITTAEIANDAKAHGLNAHAMHIGGSHEFPFGKVSVPGSQQADRSVRRENGTDKGRVPPGQGAVRREFPH